MVSLIEALPKILEVNHSGW